MSQIYQHFRPEEKEFVGQALQWQEGVALQYAPKLTDFLDPRQQFILKSLLGTDEEVKCALEGGSENGERKRALLYPAYFQPEEEDFSIGLYEIEYAEKFIRLDHRMVLGSIMSLGVKREKFGDILISGSTIQFFAALEIEPYLMMELKKIGKAGIQLKRKPLQEAAEPDEHWQETESTLSSLRLDAVIAAAFRLSRQKSQTLIQHGDVKLNWKKTENPAEDCREGDIISARGHGRCKLAAIQGRTKKDKWRLQLGVLK